MVAGSMIAATELEMRQPTGLLLGIATGFGLLAVATAPAIESDRATRIVTAVTGGFALLQMGPPTLGYFSSDAGVVTGLAVWVVGGALVAVGARRLVRPPGLAEVFGAAALLGGSALTAVQSPGFASLLGIGTGIALIVLGMVLGRVVLSLFGSVGLLVNVPWAVRWFFPDQAGAPLLLLVSGVLIVCVAVLITRMRSRFRPPGSQSRSFPPAAPTPGGTSGALPTAAA
jgi:hypothetical protein